MSFTLGSADSGLFVVDRTFLGHVLIPDGTKYEVYATRHNRDWPGTESPITFVVERLNAREVPIASYGFFLERQCWDFLTSHGTILLDVWDQQGNHSEEARDGLAIPDAYVKRVSEEVSTSVPDLSKTPYSWYGTTVINEI